VDQSELARRLGDAIAEHRGEIRRRWLDRVVAVVGESGIPQTDLIEALPEYLERAARSLRAGEDIGVAWADVARHHAVTRVQMGFDISQLVHELTVLREVIAEIAGRSAVLTGMIDAAISESVKSYVDARDHAARRAQAERVGFITHELRNPLNTAMLTSSQLRKHARSEHTRMLDILDRNHQRMRDLIDGVLLTQKMESGHLETHPTEVNLRELLGDALANARAASEAKGLAFDARFDPELTLRVDPVLTRSAVQNLVDNATQYTDHGKIEIAVEERENTLVVHVRDTCGGISHDELKTIFEPFRRGHTIKPGTGLGLAIARRGVEAQGGEIHAESDGKRGCHFWITLPKFPVEVGDEPHPVRQ
jgi:signal transduction histidine kinase